MGRKDIVKGLWCYEGCRQVENVELERISGELDIVTEVNRNRIRWK